MTSTTRTLTESAEWLRSRHGLTIHKSELSVLIKFGFGPEHTRKGRMLLIEEDELERYAFKLRERSRNTGTDNATTPTD